MFCFECNSIKCVSKDTISKQLIKMNETVNKFLLVGHKFMPEMHLKQLGFTYSTCVLFIKNKERIEKFMQTWNTNFIYKNELDKACFQQDIAYGKSIELIKNSIR